MDVIDIYDADRVPTGRVTDRPDSLLQGEYRLVIHICIFNSRGELLIQKRRDNCHKWPGVWDMTVSGCAICGEKGRDTAMREAKEELSLDLDLSHSRPAFTISFPGGFDELFIVNMEVDLDKLILQDDEVTDVRWATEDEVMALIESGRFTPVLPDYIRTIFRIRETGDVFKPTAKSAK
jgi:isopentenyldiphosphate isomerase